MLDVFHTDAFGVVPLTDAINKIPFVPGRIGGMGLFSETGVATTSVAIEERDGLLTLVAPTPRGGPGITLDKKRRVLRALRGWRQARREVAADAQHFSRNRFASHRNARARVLIPMASSGRSGC